MKKDIFSFYEKLRKENIRQSNLNALGEDLRSYNLLDILSKIGALSLIPENGSHLTRLEALAAAAITITDDSKKPKATSQKFQRIVNRHLGLNSSVTQLEDSCVNLFTESITFFDGSYIIFTGFLRLLALYFEISVEVYSCVENQAKIHNLNRQFILKL